MSFRTESADGWVQIAKGNLTRALGSDPAYRKLTLIGTAEYHLRKAETELAQDILAEAAQKDTEAAEIYTLPLECLNCGYRFTFTIAKGMAVSRGAGTFVERRVFPSWSKQTMYCPTCGCDRLKKGE